eukprot:TRINITY_DN4224_c0_g2_i3.p1 TRINITY_DN4224_c0_g2~~TRINITY_DN4224_c0_g2_i3.p1  ORF type:complete len:123 (+),score=5.18 TRINITY_DN4224_c0_g2_i3:572-940(+)
MISLARFNPTQYTLPRESLATMPSFSNFWTASTTSKLHASPNSSLISSSHRKSSSSTVSLPCSIKIKNEMMTSLTCTFEICHKKLNQLSGAQIALILSVKFSRKKLVRLKSIQARGKGNLLF